MWCRVCAVLACALGCSALYASHPCRNVVPIAALFSGTLWLSNSAYLYLSVAFIQMFKVCLLGT